MAEARAVEEAFASVRNVLLQSNEYGWTINLQITIPRPTVAGELVARWTRKFFLAAKDLFYPVGLMITLLWTAVIVTIVVSVDKSSWWRQGYLAHVVWDIAEVFPWLPVPLGLKIGILAGWTGIVVALAMAIATQIALKLLLGWHGYMYTPAKQATIQMKLWGVAVKFLTGKFLPGHIAHKPKLYSFARALPALPVPNLQSTVEKYVASVKPLLPEDKHDKLDLSAKVFLGNEGPKLQRYLHFKWAISKNYVSDWWEQYVYLRGRSSIMVNSNYYCTDYERTPTKKRQARAAMITRQMLEYKHQLDDQKIEPMMIRDTVPLCMEQHRRTFSTTRVPGRESDTIEHLDGLDQKRHVVVYSKGRYYRLDCYQPGQLPSKDSLLTPKQLEERLQVIADAGSDAVDKPVSKLPCLTSMNRTRWAEIREDHLSSGLNKVSLHVVESALFVIVLSDEKPTSAAEMGNLLLSGQNIWYDKSFNLVAFDNGRVGLNAEHAWADALVIGHLFETCVYTDTTPDNGPGYDKDGHCKAIVGEPASKNSKQYMPQRILWDIPSKGPLVEAINESYDSAVHLRQDTELVIMTFNSFGKGKIKKMRMSPDSMIQMALQLTFYRNQNKKFGLTYEASMTRLFSYGRTETIRSLSESSCNFVKIFEDPKASSAQKWSALQIAVNVHVKTAKDAMTGKGFDRHLFALYVVANGMGIESDFLKEAISQPWTLSTSQQPQRQTTFYESDKVDPSMEWRLAPGGGFGPVADDGYGVSYMVAGENRIFFHVSSKKSHSNTSSKKFAEDLSAVLKELAALHDSVSRQEDNKEEKKEK